MGQSVRGVRGATTATDNTREAITEATSQLVQSLLDVNDIVPEDIATVIFTVSPDLTAAFPAEAARELGLHDVPLLCATEIAVPSALPRCIRVLMHVNTTVPQKDIQHLYLREAQSLRPDLPNGVASAKEPSPRREVLRITPYVPGKSVEDARREFNFEGTFIKLASNENPLGPSPDAVAAGQEAVAAMHTYPDGAYVALRAALGAKWDVPPQSIIIGNGSDAIIKMIGEAYLQPGDEIVCADPSFSQYKFAADLAGARTVKVPLDDEWRHDLDAMAEAIGPRTKAVFVCNPNNPTGTVVTRDKFARFLERVPPTVLVVVDEAYGEYTTDDNASGRSFIEAPKAHVLVLRTFSKIYGLAGLRVGYGIARPEIIDVLRRVQEPFQLNAAAQAAALAALQDEEHVQVSRRANEEGKQYFYRRLDQLGMSYVPSEANFVFLNTAYDSREVVAQLLERGVIVRGGDAFGQSTWLRITIGTEAENERLFAALAEVTERMASPVM